MIYEKKTLEILADQRLLSRHNNKNNKDSNQSIIKNMNNHFTKTNILNKFNNISKLMTYFVFILYLINNIE
jgi:hypothetical protein